MLLPGINIPKQNRIIVLEMFLLYMTFFLPGFFAVPPDTVDSYIALYCIYTIPRIGLLIYIIWLRQPDTLPQLGLFNLNRRHLPYILLAYAAILLFSQALYFLIRILPQDWVSALTKGYSWEIRKPVPVILLLFFSLITGYWEELFFRSYLLMRFNELKLPLVFSLLISTIVFMFGHIYEGFLGLIIAAFMGFGLCMLFIKTKSLHVIAFVHAFYNFLALFLAQAQLFY